MKKGKWIWENRSNNADEYVKFYEEFSYKNGDTLIRLSCDSNYVLYINGQLAYFAQYADYPHYKVYDELDITSFLRFGKNTLVIIVWYYGCDSSTYIKGNAGLIFEIENGKQILCSSSNYTQCKIADDYVNNLCKNITVQLGYSFCYDSNKYDGHDKSGYIPKGYNAAIQLENGIEKLYKNPIKKLTLDDRINAKCIDISNRVYDLGRECVGFLALKFKSNTKEKITISYAEHLVSGEVQRCVETRDFSVEIISNGEEFAYMNPFRRLGCRYLQVECAADVEILYVGIHETMYPVEIQGCKHLSKIEKEIYDTCVHTLRMCMHEHYEDCPWREQALYTMDSRNQMLCGYYAFSEYTFAEANLQLMSRAQKADKLLPLCFPAGLDAPIPFFSLIYILSMNEYSLHSQDNSLLKLEFALMEDILNVFIDRIDKKGIVPTLEGYWNFYEWEDDRLAGLNKKRQMIHPKYCKSYDLPLNCFLLLALQNFSQICKRVDRKFLYEDTMSRLRKCVYDNFYDSSKGLFKTFACGEAHYSVLANSLAVLTDCSFSQEIEICKRMLSYREITPVTLSMKVFFYDALLLCDWGYKDYVLSDIEKEYSYMLKSGATTFWETIKGAEDFNGAGSLCHGWSAIPIYYYHILKK